MERVVQANIAEKYYNIGNPNYVETFKDWIRMVMIFKDFLMSLYMLNHGGR